MTTYAKDITRGFRRISPDRIKETALLEAYHQARARRGYRYILEVYDVSGATITMQSVPGRPMSSVLVSGAADVELITAKITSALQAIHTVGIIHNDPNLSNFYLDADGNVWIIDFGEAYVSYDTVAMGDDIAGVRDVIEDLIQSIP